MDPFIQFLFSIWVLFDFYFYFYDAITHVLLLQVGGIGMTRFDTDEGFDI